MSDDAAATARAFPRLSALIERARYTGSVAPAIALIYPCDVYAIDAARQLVARRIARPLLVGPCAMIKRAAAMAEVVAADFEIIDVPGAPTASVLRAIELAQRGEVAAMIKGSLHTDELMSVFVSRQAGMRAGLRISHLALYDLPRYPKLLGLTDCAVNVSPALDAKREILGNAIQLLATLGVCSPKVAVLAAVQQVNPAIPSTLDAAALVELAHRNAWPGVEVAGPLGLDSALSKDAARMNQIDSSVCGDADVLLVPSLDAGNILYKSFKYVGGGESAGLVLGASVPLVVTSRSDSTLSRIASVALAVLAIRGRGE